jgi:hypothetical protein
MVGMVVAGAVALASPAPGRAIAAIVLLLGGLAMFAGVVLGILGASFAVRVPPRTGYRGLALALVILEPSASFFWILGAFVSGGVSMDDPFARAGNAVFGLLAFLCLVAAFVIFLLFLRGLALYASDKHSARDTMVTMILGLSTYIGGAAVVGLVTFLIILTRKPVLIGVVILATFFAWVILLVLVMKRITELIAVVRARI